MTGVLVGIGSTWFFIGMFSVLDSDFAHGLSIMRKWERRWAFVAINLWGFFVGYLVHMGATI